MTTPIPTTTSTGVAAIPIDLWCKDVRNIIKPDTTIKYKELDPKEWREGGIWMHVWIPETFEGKAPIALLIHGGGFTVGCKSNIPADNVKYLLSKGFIVVSIDYRLAPHARQSEMREDWVDALKFLDGPLEAKLRAEGFGGKLGEGIDGKRTIVMGWSAGGSATCFLGADSIKAGITPPRALMPTYPMTDPNASFQGDYAVLETALSDEDREVIKGFFEGVGDTGDTMTGRTMVHGVPTPRMVWLGNVMRNKCLNSYLLNSPPPFPPPSSPITLIDHNYPPTFLLIASADKLLDPAVQSYPYLIALKKQGVECEKGVMEGMGHGPAEVSKEGWPEGVTWWEDAIRPGLDWCIERARR